MTDPTIIHEHTRSRPDARSVVDLISTLTADYGDRAVTSRAVIAGQADVELQSAFIKLKRGWTVDYVEVRGKDPKTGKGLSERMAP